MLVTIKTVGVSFAVSIPLAIVAFRVNQITARITPWLGSSSKRSRGSHSRAINDVYHGDGDEEEDVDSGSDGTTASDHINSSAFEPYHFSMDSIQYMSIYMGEYAPLFGRWNFHRRIPLLRRLWRYRLWHWSDMAREIDYPLHHALYVMRWFVIQRVVDLLARTGPYRLWRWAYMKLMEADWKRDKRVLSARGLDKIEEKRRRDGLPSLDDPVRDGAWTSARVNDSWV